MKKILSNLMLISFCSTMLTACFFGSCADWNCSKLNPRWVKAVDDCEDRNFEIVKQKFGHKDYGEVAFSDIGQHVSYQCIHHGGKYDIRKDKEYEHLFSK